MSKKLNPRDVLMEGNRFRDIDKRANFAD